MTNVTQKYPVYKTEDWIRPEDLGFLYVFVENRDFSPIEHSHDFYEFVLLFSGTLTHRINGKNYPARSGDVCMIRPGDRHLPVRESESLEACVFSVTAALAEPFLKAFGLETYAAQARDGVRCPFESAQMRVLLSSFRELQFLSRERYDMQCRLILGMLSQSYLSYFSVYGATSTIWLNNLMQDMKKAENLAQGVSALQRLANMSRPQLCRVFRKYINETPQQYVREARLSYAYNLVCNTSLPFETIAGTIGYSSLSHFSVIFKTRFQCSPSELRKKTLKLW